MAEKLRLDPSLLTPRDMKRAKAVLDGRNPYELIGDPVEAPALIIWCFKSREDPAFTWEMAENTPFGEFDMVAPDDNEPAEGDEPPPPTAELEPSGNGLGKNATSDASSNGSRSSKRRRSATSSA